MKSQKYQLFLLKEKELKEKEKVEKVKKMNESIETTPIKITKITLSFWVRKKPDSLEIIYQTKKSYIILLISIKELYPPKI